MGKKDKKRVYSENFKKKGRHNPWKWAFVLLLLFNLFIGGYWLTRSLVPQENPDQADYVLRNEEKQYKPYTFTVQTSREELTRIINGYLNSISEGEPPLFVSIDDYIDVEGSIEVFTFNLPYQIRFAPQPLADGNLKLDVVRFEVSDLSVPITFVMNLINRQLDWPQWIQIDPEEETVLINFNQLIIDEKLQVLVETMDLKNNDIQLKVLIKSEGLFDSNDE